jgi:hypothetical protein
LARLSDDIVFFDEINQKIESEGSDRATTDLPPIQVIHSSINIVISLAVVLSGWVMPNKRVGWP